MYLFLLITYHIDIVYRGWQVSLCKIGLISKLQRKIIDGNRSHRNLPKRLINKPQALGE